MRIKTRWPRTKRGGKVTPDEAGKTARTQAEVVKTEVEAELYRLFTTEEPPDGDYEIVVTFPRRKRKE